MRLKLIAVILGLAFEAAAVHCRAAPAASLVKASEFRVTGSKAFSADELAKLVADAKGKELSRADLEALASRITRFYREHGLTRARAVLPPQDFANGVVRFDITTRPVSSEPVASNQSAATPAPVAIRAADRSQASSPTGQLLERAKMWQSKQRDDLARAALQKLFSIDPNHPGGLAEMAALEARTGNREQAEKMLARLRAVAPEYPAVKQIEIMLRVTGADRNRLRQARLLAKSGRTEQAVAAYRELFPDGPPDDDLGLEYWQVIATAADGWAPAREGLARLVRAYPDNLRYRLALAEHETSRLPINREALQVLIRMSKIQEYSREALAAWRGALRHMGDDPNGIALFREYLAVDPNDSAIREQLNNATAAQAAAAKEREIRQALLADPYYQLQREGIAALDAGKLDLAEERLSQGLAGRPKDVDAIGAMGLLRLRQGHHAEAEAYFQQALQLDPGRRKKWQPLLEAARFWGLMREAGDASDAGENDLASDKLQQALAIDPRQVYAIVSLAKVRAKQGKPEDAEREYRRALSIEPANAGALSGLIELYSGTGRIVEAREVIAGLSQKQKAALGDSLPPIEAGLNRAEADQLVARGNSAAAIDLLERAVSLDPVDPWLRYDLARLYARSGIKQKGLTLFQNLLAKHPNDATALYALALYQSGIDQDREALATLERIAASAKTPKISLLQRNLWFRVQLQQARDAASAQDREKARRILSQTEIGVADDARLTSDLAYEWADLGDITHARQILERLDRGSEPLPAAWHLRYAGFLERIGAQDQLAAELQKIAATGKLTEGEAQTLAQLRDAAAIREIEALRRAGKLDAAQSRIEQLLAANPGRIALLLERAGISRDARRFDAAEADYRAVLKNSPGQAQALEGLIALYVETGRSAAAKTIIDGLSAELRAALGGSLMSVAGMMRDEADRLTAANRLDDATRLLGQAGEFAPDDPWVRYDLAKLAAKKGNSRQGQALLQDFVSKHPGDATSLYVLALYQSGQDQDLDALATLDRISKADRTPKIAAFQKSLWLRSEIARAKEFARQNQPERAKRILSSAEANLANDVELETDLAFAWADLGEQDRARQILDRLQQGRQLPVSWHLRYARFLKRSGSRDEFNRELEQIASTANLSPQDADSLTVLRESVAIDEAEALRRDGRLEQAKQAIAPYLAAKPERAALLVADANIERDAGRFDTAEAEYRRALLQSPDDSQAREGLTASLIAQGKLLDALDHVDNWLQSADDPDTRMAQVGILLDLEDYSRARENIGPLLAAAPDNSKVLGYAMRIALHDGRRADAARYQQRLQAEGGASDNRRAARKIDEKSSWVASAVDWHMRSGTPGQSQLDSIEVPVEFRTPLGSDGQAFVRTDAVTLDAGTVNGGLAREANAFGSLLLCQPNCPSSMLKQSANGISVTAGYFQPDLKLDLGTTPIGFPVSNLVGGLTKKLDLGPLTLSVELSRRPVTSSLLSFSGTRDPRTGTIWGGVTANGVRLGLSRDDGGDFGIWSSLGLHRLKGTNVQSNDRVQLMAGGYWRAINDEDRQASIGVTAMYWRFKVDAGEYTFGHGGYYSPQRYRSISIPVSFGERYNRFSYNLRGSVSKSWSAFDAAPYFPTNPAYQAGAPYYSASTGAGTGYSFNAMAEYQADPTLFLGGRFNLERSAYYAPNSLLFYLRSPMGRAAAQPVSLPPEPVLPSSQF